MTDVNRTQSQYTNNQYSLPQSHPQNVGGLPPNKGKLTLGDSLNEARITIGFSSDGFEKLKNFVKFTVAPTLASIGSRISEGISKILSGSGGFFENHSVNRQATSRPLVNSGAPSNSGTTTPASPSQPAHSPQTLQKASINTDAYAQQQLRPQNALPQTPVQQPQRQTPPPQSHPQTSVRQTQHQTTHAYPPLQYTHPQARSLQTQHQATPAHPSPQNALPQTPVQMSEPKPETKQEPAPTSKPVSEQSLPPEVSGVKKEATQADVRNNVLQNIRNSYVECMKQNNTEVNSILKEYDINNLTNQQAGELKEKLKACMNKLVFNDHLLGKDLGKLCEHLSHLHTGVSNQYQAEKGMYQNQQNIYNKSPTASNVGVKSNEPKIDEIKQSRANAQGSLEKSKKNLEENYKTIKEFNGEEFTSMHEMLNKYDLTKLTDEQAVEVSNNISKYIQDNKAQLLKPENRLLGSLLQEISNNVNSMKGQNERIKAYDRQLENKQ